MITMLFIHTLIGIGIMANMFYGILKDNTLGLVNALLLTIILINL